MTETETVVRNNINIYKLPELALEFSILRARNHRRHHVEQGDELLARGDAAVFVLRCPCPNDRPLLRAEAVRHELVVEPDHPALVRGRTGV